MKSDDNSGGGRHTVRFDKPGHFILRATGTDRFGQARGAGRDVVEHPVHPDALGGFGIGHIGVVHDEREATGPGRDSRPDQRRRAIGPVASVFPRDLRLVAANNFRRPIVKTLLGYGGLSGVPLYEENLPRFAHCQAGPLVRSSYHAHEHVRAES